MKTYMVYYRLFYKGYSVDKPIRIPMCLGETHMRAKLAAFIALRYHRSYEILDYKVV